MKTRTEAMRDLTENIFYLIVKIINHAYFKVSIVFSLNLFARLYRKVVSGCISGRI